MARLSPRCEATSHSGGVLPTAGRTPRSGTVAAGAVPVLTLDRLDSVGIAVMATRAVQQAKDPVEDRRWRPPGRRCLTG
jgi:hypothetical protein